MASKAIQNENPDTWVAIYPNRAVALQLAGATFPTTALQRASHLQPGEGMLKKMEGEKERVPCHTPWQTGQVADIFDKLWNHHEKIDSTDMENDSMPEELYYTLQQSGAEPHF